MKILIVSDAWYPQINGVVRSLESTIRELKRMGHIVHVHGPDASQWNTISAPSYASIKLEFFGRKRLERAWDDFQPDFIHIATEGPLGWVARNLCMALRRPFTTSYHTRFPEYLAARTPKGMRRAIRIAAYAVLRRFHAPSAALMVATNSIEIELQRKKFRRLVRWSRGVDSDLFKPYEKYIESFALFKRPILLNVGRVAVEKNLRAFLNCKTVGTKVVIGEGPDLLRLKTDYPEAKFMGAMEGEQLARHFAAADLFVFPSMTDTFGLVLLEAAASGLRIASYPAPGPVDVLLPETTNQFAVLNEDLQQAIDQALLLSDDPNIPRQFALGFSWPACTKIFYDHLQAPTPKAIKRITRLRNWLGRSWQRALALVFRQWHA
jgi:glycosyltransferase involved in cell wall biosynthesis